MDCVQLTTVQQILKKAQPRSIPWQTPTAGTNPFFYADAFFQLGDDLKHASDISSLEIWHSDTVYQAPNGWGSVIFPRRPQWPEAITLQGTVPAAVLRRFCSRKAFIYFLEAWAQIITALACQPLLGTHWFAFVDNEAAKFALLKGYGSDCAINNLLSLFWGFQASVQSSPWFERVSTKANLADAISRYDFTVAKQRGWLHITLDFDYTYHILQQACDNLPFATAQAGELIAQDLQTQVQQQLALHGLIV